MSNKERKVLLQVKPFRRAWEEEANLEFTDDDDDDDALYYSRDKRCLVSIVSLSFIFVMFCFYICCFCFFLPQLILHGFNSYHLMWLNRFPIELVRFWSLCLWNDITSNVCWCHPLYVWWCHMFPCTWWFGWRVPKFPVRAAPGGLFKTKSNWSHVYWDFCGSRLHACSIMRWFVFFVLVNLWILIQLHDGLYVTG